MSFDQFGLHSQLLMGIRDLGYETPTPIQEKTIPVTASGRDVIGVAQTGTGKTAAFLLPILDSLLQDGRANITRSLIIAPTRELAIQIDDVRTGLAYHTPLSGCVVYGGADIMPQVTALKGKPDIVTATPGRLIDHLWHGLPDLDSVEFLVLDEADRMLDMGFLPDIEKILRRLPNDRQNLLFSATMPPEIERLARQIMTDPEIITVGPKSRPVDKVRQELYEVEPEQKNPLLLELLRKEEMPSVLVFTRTKAGADKVFTDLRKKGIDVAVIHGDRAQSERQETMEKFRHGQVRVLVATDIASRGIDVDGISHVVNYDVPRAPEDYVHRVGRTARAGESGHAITFMTRMDGREVAAIERVIASSIPRIRAPGGTSSGGGSRGGGGRRSEGDRGPRRDSGRGGSRRGSSDRGPERRPERDSDRGSERSRRSRTDDRGRPADRGRDDRGRSDGSSDRSGDRGGRSRRDESDSKQGDSRGDSAERGRGSRGRKSGERSEPRTPRRTEKRDERSRGDDRSDRGGGDRGRSDRPDRSSQRNRDDRPDRDRDSGRSSESRDQPPRRDGGRGRGDRKGRPGRGASGR